MLMRVIIRRLHSSAVVSSQFIKAIPKKNSFSNVKYLKSEYQVALRTYVSAIPEINKSSESEYNHELSQEGYYYYNYVSSQPKFSELIFGKELIPENTNSSSSLFTTLKELNSKGEIAGEELERLLSHLKTELQNLPFYELLSAAHLTFMLYEKEHEHVWELIRNCFDKEFIRRRTSLSYNEIFMILYLLNAYGIFKKFTFSHKTIDKLSFKVDRLSHLQFVHFCYYLKKLGYIKLEKFKFEFMKILCERIPSLNQTELGLLSEALMHTQITVKNIFETFMMRVLSEIESMDAIALNSICKNLSYLKRINNLQLFIDFQEKLIPLVPKFKNHHLHNLIHSGFSIRYKNMDLYDEVMKRVKSDITDFNLMNISRFVNFNANLNVDDKEFLDMALNEFERRDNHLQYHVAYIKFLADLVHFQIYPKNLLEKVLSSDVLMNAMKYKTGILPWATLKWSLEIEKPEFVHPEVDEKLYTKFLKHMKYVKFHTQLAFHYQTRIHLILESIYGKNSVCSRRILFHYPNCSILRFDKDLKAQAIPEEFKESRTDFRMRLPCDDHIWLCIFPLHRDCYADHNEKIINYKTQTYVRQISILGYKHIYIAPTESLPHLHNDSSSQTFWASLINERLKELTGRVQHNESEK